MRRIILLLLLVLLFCSTCSAGGDTDPHVLVKVDDIQILVWADCFSVDADGYLLLHKEIDGDDWLVGVFAEWDYAYLVTEVNK